MVDDGGARARQPIGRRHSQCYRNEKKMLPGASHARMLNDWCFEGNL
jgi:hypothetical protein